MIASKAAGSYVSSMQYVETAYLSSGSYQFTITDSFGDGICCSYGSGSYTVQVGGIVAKTGGAFTYQESTPLIVVNAC